jgi:hypothetical protein
MNIPEIEWQPISRAQFIAWLVFYALLYFYLGLHFSDMTPIDNVDLVVHEAGHLLFSYFGQTLYVWGGTIFQLLVPLLLAASFAWRQHLPGVVFSSVAFFHNCLYVATYMRDALLLELPLVTVGGGEAEHDWVRIFSDLGVLPHALEIGSAMRWFGWCGLIATMGWFCWRYAKSGLR